MLILLNCIQGGVRNAQGLFKALFVMYSYIKKDVLFHHMLSAWWFIPNNELALTLSKHQPSWASRCAFKGASRCVSVRLFFLLHGRLFNYANNYINHQSFEWSFKFIHNSPNRKRKKKSLWQSIHHSHTPKFMMNNSSKS